MNLCFGTESKMAIMCLFLADQDLHTATFTIEIGSACPTYVTVVFKVPDKAAVISNNFSLRYEDCGQGCVYIGKGVTTSFLTHGYLDTLAC
ncbi:SacY-like RNA binding domain protein [Ranid herpesvirus 3]|uniref:SacY-like RNA binding domain protein n=1 Tax=Ranid herpesvirus 3 TaxID=1987509 RepID=A0A1X9T5F7_9VIRU|nr:SacY-like RNA binding domain protein [Ranid herpesvirus 3]ARR28938.1 SacY-like RNA binding domain protein [Ranid herpesvirus 3]